MAGLAGAAAILLVASALGLDLGLPTLIAGLLTALGVTLGGRSSPLPLVREISWDTLALVAGLFVIVRALEISGLQALLVAAFQAPLNAVPQQGALAAGAALAFGTYPLSDGSSPRAPKAESRSRQRCRGGATPAPRPFPSRKDAASIAPYLRRAKAPTFLPRGWHPS